MPTPYRPERLPPAAQVQNLTGHYLQIRSIGGLFHSGDHRIHFLFKLVTMTTIYSPWWLSLGSLLFRLVIIIDIEFGTSR